MGEEGFFRRSKSLPLKEGAISAIYLGERWGLPPCLPPPAPAPKQRPTARKFLTALLLAACITLTATASLLYIIRAGRGGGPRVEPGGGDWTGEVVISGEFKILNVPYRPSLSNFTSADFIQLSASIGQHLNELYSRSGVSGRFRGATVIELGPGLTVKCRLVMLQTDSLTVSRVGLAFLAGLKHSQGHLTLGPYVIDIQSIGFQASAEEVSWSQWSDWGPCEGGNRERRRVCLSLTGLKLRDTEACRPVRGIHDRESEPCPGREVADRHRAAELPSLLPVAAPTTTTTRTTTSRTTTSRATTTQTTTRPTSRPTPPPSTPPPITLNSNVTTTPPTSGVAQVCAGCARGEVCVGLQGEESPRCRPAVDPSDPTGCGGLCALNTEICHRLTDLAFRCVDDSKCLEDEWQCGNQLCIPLVKRCDGHFNCYDHTDEVNCDCDLDTHFRCGKNLSCLPKSKKCDAIVDCWDATDESSCTIACLDSAQFTCNDSQCIESRKFCDGFPDCRDHSDEPFGCGGLCKHHEWRCSNGRCIVKRERCNGKDDCGDNSDEANCGNRRKPST